MTQMNLDTHKRNPVLLIHGIFDTGRVFARMVPYLQARGWDVYDLDLVPNHGTAGLDELAVQVAEYVNKTFPLEQPLDLVGFSMGGLVSRYYVQRLGGIKRIQRFVSLSAPNNGTWVAYFNQGRGCVQMRPDSAFLKDLNRDVEMLSQINFTSIWTPYDLMIVPANSSSLPVGNQAIAPVMTHAWMLTDYRSLEKVAQALSAPIVNPGSVVS